MQRAAKHVLTTLACLLHAWIQVPSANGEPAGFCLVRPQEQEQLTAIVRTYIRGFLLLSKKHTLSSHETTSPSNLVAPLTTRHLPTSTRDKLAVYLVQSADLLRRYTRPRLIQCALEMRPLYRRLLPAVILCAISIF